MGGGDAGDEEAVRAGFGIGGGAFERFRHQRAVVRVAAPVILIGLFFGRWLLAHVSQKLFDGLILAFAAGVALWRIGFFDLFRGLFS